MRWQDDAACLGMDTDLFFPTNGPISRHITDVCERCPVHEYCLNDSLKHGVEHGVWAGLPREVRKPLAPPYVKSDLHRERIGIGRRLAQERKKDLNATAYHGNECGPQDGEGDQCVVREGGEEVSHLRSEGVG